MFSPPSFRAASIMVVLVLAAAFALMLKFENQQRPYLQQFSEFTRQDAVWHSFSSMEEFHQLHNATELALRNPKPETLEQVRLSYEIFAGRISAFQNGAYDALTNHNSAFQKNIKLINQWVNKTDLEIATGPMTLEQVKKLEPELHQIEDQLKEVVHSLQVEFSTQMEISKAHIDELASYRMGLYALMFVVMAGFAFFALHNLWASQQRQIELLAAQDKAMQANEAKSQFLANVSHEMRTPLTTVLGYSEQLQQDPTLTAKQSQSLNHIHHASRYLLSLIGNVLDMSKIEVGRVVLSNEVISIPDLINELEGMFWHQAKIKGLQLEFHIASDVPAYVQLDGGKWRQILVNLLGNAIKFSEQGKIELHLSASKINDHDLFLNCTIADQGLGIAPDEHDKVFVPFAQTASGRHIGGTGLGLAISLEYARFMGGDITFCSAPDQGSQFTASVVAAIAEAPNLNDYATEKNLSGLGVLIVEDQAINRELLSDLCKRFGATVYKAEHGAQALEILVRHPNIAIVLMDRNMPVMDGLTATQEMRQNSFAQPVLMISAGLPPSEAEMQSSGLNAWLSKPFSTAQLHQAMNALLHLPSDGSASLTEAESAAPDGVPLLDVEGACQRLGYNMQRYQLMAQKGLDRIAEIIETWPTSEPETEKTRLAHSAKGIARQIGAEQLGDYFAQLENDSDNQLDSQLLLAQELLAATRRRLQIIAI
ncbi:response regulator [Chitinibacter bivalviorum]|uniref:histidine kinase n=1 Tax=Chitinibacter bivalviorum TaxID=2739434 RepID=A0A7H9BJN4_9NEIS|nr:ATP-binding protein [Chitinibacter bivalviorum]QLG88458.1 response regulator [Chitinibacter bivalviorum]